ncbi:YaaC family protein [Tenacibaculum mesophilum]|uniref:YaaC family protein n=1 Tax=Tenacibaculum mesophilum TaxID=104268 RepID=UPI000649585B|nr:YaaC family protein [Tenacibaculum mesophilum]
MKYERIFSETPKSSIWDRIDILTTINGTKEALKYKCEKQNVPINEELITNKAKGIAFCLRSAKDLFKQSNSKNLTPSLTSLYYGTYNLLSAILIGDINNELTLESVEKFSKNGGHGLKSIYQPETENLAKDEFIYCCNNGFYKEILKNFGYKVNEIVTLKNYSKIEKVPDEEKQKLISLKDLLSRVPELKNIYVELFKEQPNYLNFYGTKNYEKKDKDYYHISVNENQNSYYLNSDLINDILSIPSEYKFEYKKERPDSTLDERFYCENIPEDFIQRVPKYHSPIAINCSIKPILGIDDVLLIYFKTFYILSIWTRYRPNLWREVYEGKYDNYRSLFSILTESAERIIPNLFLNKFYGRTFTFASHSYYS